MVAVETGPDAAPTRAAGGGLGLGLGHARIDLATGMLVFVGICFPLQQ